MKPYEPSPLEVRIILTVGTLAAGFYREYIDRLDLTGAERFLDFGSGSGVCSRHLARRLGHSGGRLTCLDVSTTWNQVIRRTLRSDTNVDFCLGSILDLGQLPNQPFTAIFIHFVLHDIPSAERPAIVRALAQRLIPGGRIFLREPSGKEGIAVEEIHALLESAGLAQASARSTAHWFTGPMLEGVYRKTGTAAP